MGLGVVEVVGVGADVLAVGLGVVELVGVGADVLTARFGVVVAGGGGYTHVHALGGPRV